MTSLTPVGADRSLRTGFLRSVSALPSAPALVVKGVARTYGELDRTARLWAGALIAAAGPVRRVGIFGSRSEVSYTGVLAALYSGATFVPLNPTFPSARTRAMIASAELDAIIVDAGAASQLSGVLADLDRVPPVLAPVDVELRVPAGVTTVTHATVAAATPLDELPPLVGSDIAYLLFTSGSTGVPKGVPVTHANAVHFMDWASNRYEITPEDRFSQTFDQTFDLSVFDLFVAWSNGASVYAMQPLDLLAPARFVERNALTVWFSVPSIPALMRKKGSLKPSIFPTLRWSLFCGEPLPRASAEAWQAAAPGSVVENLYGPTELTIACLVHRWDPERSPALCVNDVVPIGQPFAGLTECVVDESRGQLPLGETGELCVCGPQTVPGYWRNPQKTAEQFVILPLPAGGEDRFYRTGDRVQRLPSGDYVYLGRVDHQVKVLGHRVELAEIEAVIGRHPGIAQGVALGWPVRDGSAEGIVAFVTGTGLVPDAVIADVRRVLPDYMTPRAVFVVDELPLNANGKVDRPLLVKRLESGEYAHA
jgi:amino acid adenylation domain-containing protein